MNRGPENVFGKAQGRYDEMMARRLVRTLPEQALAACAAMDDEAFREFATLFNALFSQGARVAGIGIARLGGHETAAKGERGTTFRRVESPDHRAAPVSAQRAVSS